MRKLTYQSIISQIDGLTTDIWYVYPTSVIKVPFASHTHEILKVGSDEMIVVSDSLDEIIITLDLKTLVNVVQIQPVGGNANTVDVSLSTLTTNSAVTSMPVQQHDILTTPDQINKIEMVPGEKLDIENEISFATGTEMALTLKPGSVLQNSNQVAFGGSLNSMVNGTMTLEALNDFPVNIGGSVTIDNYPTKITPTEFFNSFINWPVYYAGITTPMGTIVITFISGATQTITFDHNTPPQANPVITIDGNGIVVFSGFIDNATGYKKYLSCHYSTISSIQYSWK